MTLSLGWALGLARGYIGAPESGAAVYWDVRRPTPDSPFEGIEGAGHVMQLDRLSGLEQPQVIFNSFITQGVQLTGTDPT